MMAFFTRVRGVSETAKQSDRTLSHISLHSGKARVVAVVMRIVRVAIIVYSKTSLFVIAAPTSRMAGLVS